MRTKTKVLSALVGLASFGALVAQAQVYSLNVVGYVNTVINPGFNLVNNPLDTTNNTVGALLPAPPEGTKIYIWGGHGYTPATFDWDDNAQADIWDTPNAQIAPGIGFFFFNPTATAFTNTWVGNVKQGTFTNVVSVGFSLQASVIPQASSLTNLGYVPVEGDKIYQWTGHGYNPSTYDWDDNAQADIWDQVPQIGVGEGFFILSQTGTQWIRTFNVQ